MKKKVRLLSKLQSLVNAEENDDAGGAASSNSNLEPYIDTLGKSSKDVVREAAAANRDDSDDSN